MVGKILSDEEVDRISNALETKDSAVIASAIFTIDSVCKDLKKLFLGVGTLRMLEYSYGTDSDDNETVIMDDEAGPLMTITIKQQDKKPEYEVLKSHGGKPRKSQKSFHKILKKVSGGTGAFCFHSYSYRATRIECSFISIDSFIKEEKIKADAASATSVNLEDGQLEDEHTSGYVHSTAESNEEQHGK